MNKRLEKGLIMNKKIVIEYRNVYGKTLVYPISDNAKVFTSIAKTTTLSVGNLRNIKRLGFDIETIRQTVVL